MTKTQTLTLTALIGFFAALFALVYFSPVQTGGDWNMIATAIREWLFEGKMLYRIHPVADGMTTAPYVYSPFATALMLPFALLPTRFIWTMLFISNNVILLGLCRKFGISIWKALLLMACPAALYNIIFGQVDISFMALILLPQSLWGLVALVKPQLLMGILIEAFRSRQLFIRIAITTGVAVIISVLLLGDWTTKVAELAPGLKYVPHNAMRFIWPYGIPIGLVFLAAGFYKKDHLLYLAGSPFLTFYASTGGLIGLALALAKWLKTWQFCILWFLWWGYIAFSATR